MPFDGDSDIYEGEVHWLFRKDPQYQGQHHRQQARDTVAIFDSLEKLFDDGRHWIRKIDTDRNGNYCLRGGLTHIAGQRGRVNCAGRYLARAMVQISGRKAAIPAFNDNCSGYPDIARLIHRARELAQAAADGRG
jgi:hypothetical protein